MRRVAIRAAAVCVLAAFGLAMGAAAPATSGKTKPQLRDNGLRDEIVTRLARSKSADDHFQIHVQGTSVTISGKTDVVQHKASATRMAKSAGALTVVNKIEVSAAGKAKSTAGLRRAGLQHRSEAAARSERTEKR
ncbi:MAG: hypothetical protein ABI693_17150 [Bryobacteraceae bacterium]